MVRMNMMLKQKERSISSNNLDAKRLEVSSFDRETQFDVLTERTSGQTKHQQPPINEVLKSSRLF